MAFLSIKEYTGDGVTTDFLFDISYIKEADVHGFVDDVDSTISFVDPTTVRFAVAPATGTAIQIKRLTDNAAPRHSFPNPSFIKSTNLDGNSEQYLFLAQEQIDGVGDAYAASIAAAASEAAAAASASAAAADAVSTAADVVLTGADVVLTSADVTASGLNVTYSQEWANKAEDSLISVAAGGNGVDEYSARHWAAKAQIVAGDYMPLGGGTMDAAADITFQGGGEVLGLPATPSVGGAAASKTYADTKQTKTENVTNLEINSNGVGDRNAFIDLHSSDDASQVDFSCRFIRAPGVNGDATLQNKGAGVVGLVTGSASAVLEAAGNMRVSATSPLANNHLTRKDYTDSVAKRQYLGVLDLTGGVTQGFVTGIPAEATKIILQLEGISLVSGVGFLAMQLAAASTPNQTGAGGGVSALATASQSAQVYPGSAFYLTNGLPVSTVTALNGQAILTKQEGTNSWFLSGMASDGAAPTMYNTAGGGSASGIVDSLRIYTTGANNFGTTSRVYAYYEI